MRSLLVVAGAAVLLLLAAPAAACTSGYEPPGSILRRAGHVIEVEVLSISSEQSHSAWGSEKVVKVVPGGRARVRITSELRGEMPVREFTLRGGPYHSCAPYECFFDFEVGEKLWLLLDGPVPAGTEIVEIAWRGRVFKGTADEIRAMLERLRIGRERRLALLREIAPEAFERAEALAGRFREGGTPSLADEPWPVLDCLAEILHDPIAPLPFPPREPLAPKWTAGYSHGRPLPAALQSARRRSLDDPQSEELARFRERLLLRWTETFLEQPAERARRFVHHVRPQDLRLDDLPTNGVSVAREAPEELKSVATLTMFAADNPGRFVHHAFARADVPERVEVFAPFLRAHADEVPARDRWLEICLELRDPCAAPIAIRAFEGEAGPGWLPELLAFFLAVGDEERAAEGVMRAEEFRGWNRAARARMVGEMLEAAEAAGALAGRLRGRLAALHHDLKK